MTLQCRSATLPLGLLLTSCGHIEEVQLCNPGPGDGLETANQIDSDDVDAHLAKQQPVFVCFRIALALA